MNEDITLRKPKYEKPIVMSLGQGIAHGKPLCNSGSEASGCLSGGLAMDMADFGNDFPNDPACQNGGTATSGAGSETTACQVGSNPCGGTNDPPC
jgi:hypothetical protein